MPTFPTTTTTDGVVVVRPAGRLNMTLTPTLRNELDDLVARGNTRLVVDLAAVERVDSSVIGALIHGLKAARKAGGDLRIVAPSAQVRTLLETAHLTQILPSYMSIGDAFSTRTA